MLELMLYLNYISKCIRYFMHDMIQYIRDNVEVIFSYLFLFPFHTGLRVSV